MKRDQQCEDGNLKLKKSLKRLKKDHKSKLPIKVKLKKNRKRNSSSDATKSRRLYCNICESSFIHKASFDRHKEKHIRRKVKVDLQNLGAEIIKEHWVVKNDDLDGCSKRIIKEEPKVDNALEGESKDCGIEEDSPTSINHLELARGPVNELSEDLKTTDVDCGEAEGNGQEVLALGPVNIYNNEMLEIIELVEASKSVEEISVDPINFLKLEVKCDAADSSKEENGDLEASIDDLLDGEDEDMFRGNDSDAILDEDISTLFGDDLTNLTNIESDMDTTKPNLNSCDEVNNQLSDSELDILVNHNDTLKDHYQEQISLRIERPKLMKRKGIKEFFITTQKKITVDDTIKHKYDAHNTVTNNEDDTNYAQSTETVNEEHSQHMEDMNDNDNSLTVSEVRNYSEDLLKEVDQNCGIATRRLRSKLEDTQKSKDKRSENFYPCNICCKSLASMSDLTSHNKSSHPGRPRIPTCTLCEKTFTREYTLMQHTRVHLGILPYSCDLCDRAYETSGTMRKHRITCKKILSSGQTSSTKAARGTEYYSRKIIKPKGQNCSITFRRIGCQVEELKQIHSGEGNHRKNKDGNKFPCNICLKSFARQSSLTSHLNSSHPGRQKIPTCTICKTTFTKEDTLMIHTRKHLGIRPYSCDKCDKAYALSSAVDKHKKKVHGESSYTCKICKKIFPSVSVLSNHIKADCKDEHLFPCNVCLKSFVRSIDLTLHIGSSHPERNNTSTCTMCDKTFTTDHTLMQHTRMHLGILPYSCDFCHKGHATSSQVNKHKKNSCKICKKCFPSATLLSNHIETNCKEITSIRTAEITRKTQQVTEDNDFKNYSYSSEICNKGFTDLEDCMKHEQTHVKNIRRGTSSRGRGEVIDTTEKEESYFDNEMDNSNKENIELYEGVNSSIVNATEHIEDVTILKTVESTSSSITEVVTLSKEFIYILF